VNIYQQRDDLLRRLFGQTYQEYLASLLWDKIRTEIMRRAAGRCHLCHNVATQVHHSKYTRENLLGTNLKGLNAICATCHRGIEIKDDGTKRTPEEVAAVLAICRKADVRVTQKSRAAKIKAEQRRENQRRQQEKLAGRY
jgi:hypothetical protein